MIVDETIEKTRSYEGAQSPQKAIESATFAHRLLNEILDYIKPGVLESEVKQFALHLFDEHAIERTWHPPYVRFGSHTLLTFRDKAKEDFTLAEDDIAFVDIGIVKDGVEGDAGRSIIFGNSAEYRRLQAASTEIFAQAREFWRRNNPTGIEIYDYVHALARQMDVEFNLDPAGHLIGEFPHRGWKKGINHYPQNIMPGCWILEIQICNTAREYGAFYEDLLY